MKFILIICLLSGFSVNVKAQNTVATQLAEKIAQKMKDSLLLSESQKEQLYTINLQLSDRKSAVRQQYATSDSLGIKIQLVEKTRDSLYKAVLTEQQFILYRQKKKNLVNNN